MAHSQEKLKHLWVKKETIELAVMIDTFSPLQYADILSTIDDSDYPYSWQES